MSTQIHLEMESALRKSVGPQFPVVMGQELTPRQALLGSACLVCVSGMTMDWPAGSIVVVFGYICVALICRREFP